MTGLLWAALASPIGFLAANATRHPSLIRVSLAVGFLLVLGVILMLLFRVVGVSRGSGGVEAGVAVIIWSYFGMVDTRFVSDDGMTFLAMGTLLAIGGGLAVASIGRRLPVAFAIAKAGIVAAVVAAAIPLVGSSLAARASGSMPDVVVVFVDGYASQRTLESFGYDNSAFYQELEATGFTVVPDAKSSYSMTYVSIASTLASEYMAEGGESIQGSFRDRLYQTMGGRNRFVDAFRDLGYEYVHIESGWSGTRCGPEVDRCVGAPLIEETAWSLIQRTAAARLVEERIGHSFVVGGLATINSLLSLELEAGEPEVVFSHLLLPHPPMFLGADCKFSYSTQLGGMNVWGAYLGGPSTRELRVDAYLEQLSCTNKLLGEVVSDPELADAILVIIGDHGPDSHGQLVTPVEDWSEEQVDERMQTILAIRGCGPSIPDHLINALSFVLQCSGVESPRALPYRSFLVPVEENHPQDSVIEIKWMLQAD